jgi:uncharacterized protein YndB with AHSA1/START domain
MNMSENLKLQMKRVIKAKREAVFEAWTKPELMRKWLAPGEMTVASAVAELKIGGSYRVAMVGDNGSGKCVNAAIEGKYKKIVPNELLCFTWGWPDNPMPETLVTVEFKDAKGGTEVTLTHEGFTSAEVFGKHQHGWLGCFDNLEKFFQQPRNAEIETAQTDPAGYARRIEITTPRERVFDAIATPEGICGWWATTVKGSGKTGGDLRLEFEGLEEHIIMHVDEAKRPSSVKWTCTVHTELPEWAGTKPTFDLVELTPKTCELHFRHTGLTPQLECHDHCEIGWNRFLASLVAYIERGKGAPYRAARETTRMA